MKHEADFETTICGIPCGIAIDDFDHVPGNPNCTDSSDDYYGYTICNWTVLDRKGYVANWLRQKMSEQDVNDIDIEVFEYSTKEDPPEPDYDEEKYL